jgi:WD40 repeat protein
MKRMEDKKRAGSIDTTGTLTITRKQNASKRSKQRQKNTAPPALFWTSTSSSSCTPTDVFCRLPHLLVAYLDRVSLNRLFSANKVLYAASRTVTLPWPEKRILLSIGLPVYSVQFSPNGGLLACGCRNGTIQIWNSNSRNRLNTNDGAVAVAAAVVDGRPAGTPIVLQGHAGIVKSLAFSPNGKLLASGGHDGMVRLWKLLDNNNTNTNTNNTNNIASSCRVLEGHESFITSVVFSLDGATLASASYDGSIRLWNVANGQCIRTFRQDDRTIYVVAWSPDGKTIAVANRGGLMYLLDIHPNTIRAPVIIPGGRNESKYRGVSNATTTTTMTLSPDGRYVLSGGQDYTLRLWNPTSCSGAQQVFEGRSTPSRMVRSICFSPKRKMLVSGSYDPSGSGVRLVNVNEANGSCRSTLSSQYYNLVFSVSFSPDGRSLASAGLDGIVCVGGNVRCCTALLPVTSTIE